ncbi:hypothetical protein AK88_01158 [Plasmodium fragile]|uniref:Uncharacterized protein n=1 Tax=Plasmodium fragile TaxID=5857 RepID=A0A0D9QQS6_PLAFR|nr:uncharacterized protein AK88_01158 [Plasmodium fragile]KJP89278.1 hypothetical protein AK88_01158 [Plasmodium fragile]
MRTYCLFKQIEIIEFLMLGRIRNIRSYFLIFIYDFIFLDFKEDAYRENGICLFNHLCLSMKFFLNIFILTNNYRAFWHYKIIIINLYKTFLTKFKQITPGNQYECQNYLFLYSNALKLKISADIIGLYGMFYHKDITLDCYCELHNIIEEYKNKSKCINYCNFADNSPSSTNRDVSPFIQ